MINKARKKKTDKELTGIDGWLIVFLIFLLANLVFLFRKFINGLIYGGVAPLNLADQGLTLILIGVVLVLFFKKSHSTPKWVISVLWFTYATGIITDMITRDFRYLIYVDATIMNIIFTLYFIKSRRVKNTFTK